MSAAAYLFYTYYGTAITIDRRWRKTAEFSDAKKRKYLTGYEHFFCYVSFGFLLTDTARRKSIILLAQLQALGTSLDETACPQFDFFDYWKMAFIGITA